MKIRYPYIPIYGLLLLLLAVGCTAPRSIIQSGKVTPRGEFKIGLNTGANLASAPLSQLDDITNSAIDAVTGRDSVFYDQQIDVFAQALTAYALDPVGPAFDLYVRYGPVTRLDVGYKFASGVHVLDAMYQFMGPTGTPENPGIGNFYGSIGLQYSGQEANILKRFNVNRLVPLLDFTARRRDLVIPLIFSRSFGPEEEIGNISWGLVYHHSFFRYGFSPDELYERVGDQVRRINPVTERSNFPAFGAFVNGKIGYKFLYALPAVAVYYQNYGSYQLLAGKQFSFKGVRVVPTIGLQLRLGGFSR
ncbi:hypothetical protein [Cesiribacter andamanensis]|nr:hypothetical protein [Cesiribacter andamanensis]